VASSFGREGDEGGPQKPRRNPSGVTHFEFEFVGIAARAERTSTGPDCTTLPFGDQPDHLVVYAKHLRLPPGTGQRRVRRAHVRSVNPATGQWEYPCLISIATDRATYLGLNLRDVEPDVCLRHLNALVSHNRHGVEPVTPIRDFDLARYAFIEAVDVVASLDSRTDLTKISPTEFEYFVRQLFEASGLEGWTAERSRDDGVDAVVINRDPMVGGLTIVQAKRYTNVIGVSHIRELVGAWTRSAPGEGSSSQRPGSQADAKSRPGITAGYSSSKAQNSFTS